MVSNAFNNLYVLNIKTLCDECLNDITASRNITFFANGTGYSGPTPDADTAAWNYSPGLIIQRYTRIYITWYGTANNKITKLGYGYYNKDTMTEIEWTVDNLT